MRAASFSFPSIGSIRRLGASTLLICALSPLLVSVACAQTVLTSDHVHLLIAGRIAERLIVLLAAILSLTFGFLSLKSGGPARGALEAGAQHVFWVKLRNVGPGVFFCAFGTALLLWSLQSKLDLDLPQTSLCASPASAQSPSAEPGRAATARVSYGIGIAGLDDAHERRRLLAAMLTAERMIVANRPTLSKTELVQLRQAIETLEPVKAAVVDSEAGYAGAYQWWQKLKRDPGYGNPDFEEKLLDKDRATLRAIEQLQSDALAASQ